MNPMNFSKPSVPAQLKAWPLIVSEALWLVPGFIYAFVVLVLPPPDLAHDGVLVTLCRMSERFLRDCVPFMDFFRHVDSVSFPSTARVATSFVPIWWFSAMLGTMLRFMPAIRQAELRLTFPHAENAATIIMIPLLMCVYTVALYGLPGTPMQDGIAALDNRAAYWFLTSCSAMALGILGGYWPILVLSVLADRWKGTAPGTSS